MKSQFPVSAVNRVPVLFGRDTICDAIRFVQLSEVQPIYPLTSVFVSASGHEPLRLATAKVMEDAPEWSPEVWPDRAALFLNIYTHLLANLVSYHVSGRWLKADEAWMVERAVSSKAPADAETSRDAIVPHVAEFVLLGEFTVRMTSTMNGRLEASA